MRIRPRRPLHFLHIRKTGGTAIKAALMPYRTAGRYELHLYHHNTSLRDIPVGEGVVVFLRDPVSRYVSGFYSRQREGRPRYVRPWTDGEREAFTHFTTPDQLASALSSDDGAERERAERAMRSISHVGHHLALWLDSEEYLRSRADDLFFVGSQEHLDADFRELRRLLKLEEAELPTDPVEAHMTPPDLDRSLSTVAQENLTRWYADDYRLIDVCREIAPRPQRTTSNSP